MPTTAEPLPTSPGSHRADRPRAAGVVRVVIADDHPVYRDGVIRALLESGRYEIVGEAGDGAAALGLIERHRPDVALLDLRMPALDALGVLQRLDDDGIQVPVVVISAFTQPQIIDRALAAGAAGYLSKDAPREEILVALEAAASGARVVQDSGAHARGRAPLIPVERALLIFLNDGWSLDELPAITGLDAETVERHLVDAAIKLGTRNADDTLARAVARGLVD
jgi:two-component system nitrate/nitrite response regulator NarL